MLLQFLTILLLATTRPESKIELQASLKAANYNNPKGLFPNCVAKLFLQNGNLIKNGFQFLNLLKNLEKINISGIFFSVK